MPLRLRSLELYGFKTFATRTLFEFAPGITAIVGPNGSGKSNIADALRWVLGEQSYSLLRAKKTEDMIFAGSELRPRAGMAAVTVTFENSDGWLPLDFSEVALTRRAYRDGRNEYLLNGQAVRLRDINELLAQSGLAERTYTILGQGLVDASLALKADERRRLFEEAAGIGLYRARREEALRRLEATHHNLERILDLLAELEPRLKHLERQARRAQEYAQMQADLRLLLRDWYGYHWHRAQQELLAAREALHLQEQRAQEARRTYQQAQETHAAFRAQIQQLRAQLNAWHRQSAEWHRQREEISRELAVNEERQRALAERLNSLQAERERLHDEQRRVEQEIAATRATVERLEKEVAEAAEQLGEAERELSDVQAARAVVEEALQAARGRLEALQTQRSQAQARLDEGERRLEALRPRLEQALAENQRLEATLQAANAAVAQCAQARLQTENALAQAQAELLQAQLNLTQAETLVQERHKALQEAEAKITRLRARLEVLEQAEQSLAGYAEGARLLLEAARKGQLGGTRGALSALLEVTPGFEEAVRAALGEVLDAVVLEAESLEQALGLLEQIQGERVALLPLSDFPQPAALVLPQDDECLGWAAAKVNAPAELQAALARLLEGIVVARHRQSAPRLLAQLPPTVRAVVTLRGEVFRREGVVLAGGEGRPSALGRARQKRELQAELEQAAKALEEAQAQWAQAEAALRQAREQLRAAEAQERAARQRLDEAHAAENKAQLEAEAARRQAEWQKAQAQQLAEEIQRAEAAREQLRRLGSELEAQLEQAQTELRRLSGQLAEFPLEDLRQQVTYWKTRHAVGEQSLNDARRRHQEQEETSQRLQERAVRLAQEMEEIEQSRMNLAAEEATLRARAQEVHTRLSALQAEIQPTEAQLEQAEAELTHLQEAELNAQRNLALAERLLTQAQMELSRRQEALETLHQRITDDFGLVRFEEAVTGPVPLPLEGMVETLPLLNELPAGLEEQISRQRAQLRRLGPVNPQAQEEYESEQERLAFLKTQVDDLRKAEADLRQVIAELDERTRQEFQKTFQAVDRHFREIFVRLFGGGSARLTLTDPENLVETGIEIEARLPGRREQGLALLSGGERSLTAIALVFALLKVSPTPLCVMDEVDAMLDEANVGRFRDLLQELSQETQFIIITHNRNTVQAAEVIYGVTMGRDSTSQVISLRLDEVGERVG